MNMTLSPTVRDTLTSAGWIWPAYIRNGVVYKLAEDLRALPVADRPAFLETALPGLYRSDDLAVMLLERYRKVPLIAPHQAAISEAIEAAHLGLFHAAVATLFPVIEGILRTHAGHRGGDLGGGTRRLASEIGEMIAAEHAKFQGRSDSLERISMLEIFRDFLTGTLLESTRQFAGHRELNRHGVLAGVNLMHPLTTTTSPHRPPSVDLGSWASFGKLSLRLLGSG
jgi:hypothetical protein